MRLVWVIALAVLALPATTAGATTVRALPQRLEVTGDPGEVNVLVLRHDLDREVVRVEDSRPIATVDLGGRACARLGPRAVECPHPAGESRRRFAVDLGDRDDRLLIDAPRASPEVHVALALFSEVRDGPGDDAARSVPTTTTFVTGPGDDFLQGAVEATPGGGDDRIVGTVGPDVLDGGFGRDVILGRDGADVLRGGASRDRLFGEGGRDRLFGGLGDDYLRGGTARDLLAGGPGRDTEVQG